MDPSPNMVNQVSQIKSSQPPILVLGAAGFIGSHLTRSLLKDGWRVRAFSRRFDPRQVKQLGYSDRIQIHEGSVFDESALTSALQGVSTVINLLSFSVPTTSSRLPQTEITTTVQANNLLLSAMIKSGATRLVFPSSGGTIYGDVGNRPAHETDPPAPRLSYGLGKLICEETIHFYHRMYGLSYLILRISNAYGAARIRRVSQGVIDVFLEQAYAGQPLHIWGNLDTVRDYIFIDDLMAAILKLLRNDPGESHTVNVGSGRGNRLHEVLAVITEVTGLAPTIHHEEGVAGLAYNVLNNTKLCSLIDWKPQFDLEAGICETWNRKRQLAPELLRQYSPG
jgi:UDP-glucose 4-epimerase